MSICINNLLFILLEDIAFWIDFDAMKMATSQKAIIDTYP